MFSSFLSIFGPKRPLKPTRKSPTVQTVQRPLDVHKFNIIVTVIRAFGIPTRNEDFFQANRRNSAISTNKQAAKGSTVRPFISINLNQTTVRTSTAEGVNPTWNEQLTIPFK
jgi:coiled-coil and C2 domain-containing protein 2A